MSKFYILKLANFLAFFWHLIPEFIRLKLFFGFFILESRGDEKKGLKKLFLIKDKLNLVINERALNYGKGIHPKHSLTKYHDFFIENILNGENVLDIGCGYGAVATSVALKKDKSKIIGIDYDENKLSQAIENNKLKNLKFVSLDATKNIPKGKWDVIILSNVLEHISKRVLFLKKVVQNSKCRKILIRVPCFERDWEVPMRKKLKINFYSDNDHKIEHTIQQFLDEMIEVGINVTETKTTWGEIWAVCKINKSHGKS